MSIGQTGDFFLRMCIFCIVGDFSSVWRIVWLLCSVRHKTVKPISHNKPSIQKTRQKNQQNNNPASQVTFTTNFVHLIFRLWAGMCSSSPAPKHFYFICEYSVNILLLICVLCVYWVIISSGLVTHVVISSQFICCCCCCYVRGACFSLAQIFPPLWTFFFLCRFFLYRFQQHSVALFFAVVAGDHVHF